MFKKRIPGKAERAILNGYIKAVKELSKILTVVDNESYKLRYHINKEKMACFDHGFQINCKNLLDSYYKYIGLGHIVWGFTEYFPDPDYEYDYY